MCSRACSLLPRLLTTQHTHAHTCLANDAQNVIFKHLQTGNRIQIWLYDNLEARLEGRLRVRPHTCTSNVGR